MTKCFAHGNVPDSAESDDSTVLRKVCLGLFSRVGQYSSILLKKVFAQKVTSYDIFLPSKWHIFGSFTIHTVYTI